MPSGKLWCNCSRHPPGNPELISAAAYYRHKNQDIAFAQTTESDFQLEDTELTGGDVVEDSRDGTVKNMGKETAEKVAAEEEADIENELMTDLNDKSESPHPASEISNEWNIGGFINDVAIDENPVDSDFYGFENQNLNTIQSMCWSLCVLMYRSLNGFPSPATARVTQLEITMQNC
jgi:hypothetical protein